VLSAIRYIQIWKQIATNKDTKSERSDSTRMEAIAGYNWSEFCEW
jgi:hypothetical protein